MNTFFKTCLLVSISILPLLLSSCASLQAYMRQQELARCNTNSAYSQGMNDGRDGRDMTNNYAQNCPKDQIRINDAYASGYRQGIKHPKPQQPSKHHRDRWGCMTSFGQQTCGYDCIKDPFGKIYCGQKRHDNCVENRFNDVKCGYHCRVDPYDNIKCDKERYASH